MEETAPAILYLIVFVICFPAIALLIGDVARLFGYVYLP